VPGPLAAGHGLRHLGPDGVGHPHQAEQLQAGFGRIGCGGKLGAGELAPGERQHSGSSADSVRMARSARYSWAKLNRPLTTIAAMIATLSCGIRPTNASPEAIHSMIAKKWSI
jgi:hypothetical protein